MLVSVDAMTTEMRSTLEGSIPEMLKIILLSLVYPALSWDSRGIPGGSWDSQSIWDKRDSQNIRYWDRQCQTVPQQSGSAQVSLQVPEYPGDGSVTFRRAGSWSCTSGLILQGPLTPAPSSNFKGRTLILTAVNKPRVFEVQRPPGTPKDLQGPPGTLRDLQGPPRDPQRPGSLKNVQGYMAELVRVLEIHLNFSSVVTTTNAFGCQSRNGSWDGMIGLLARKQADLAPLDLSPSWDRTQVIDFSQWMGIDNVIILSRSPHPLRQPFLLLQVFSPWVWLAILLTGVATGSVLWAMDHIVWSTQAHRLSNGLKTPYKLYETAVVSTLKLFVMQGSKWSCSSWSGRLASCWVFLAVVSLVSLYQGTVVSFLAVPRIDRAIDSALELIDRLHTVTPVVRKNTVYYEFIINFEKYRKIADNLMFLPDSYLDTWDFYSHIQQGKYALIDTWSSSVGRSVKYEGRQGQCRYHQSSQVLKSDLDVMTFPHNSLYKDLIDHKLVQLRSFGIINKLRSVQFMVQCQDQPVHQVHLKSLDIYQVSPRSHYHILSYPESKM
nr:glutamate receptor ionotropic, delta-1-like [Cherax quadricarinatus]